MATPRFALTTLVEGQASGEVTANASLIALEALMNGSVIDRDLTAPPGSPTNGDLYLVGAAPTGAWTGQTLKFALYYNGWLFFTPKSGQTMFIVDEKAAFMYSAVESLWFPLQPLWSATEHWTGRYIGSNKVYSKTITFGAVPGASAVKSVAHGIASLLFTGYNVAEVSVASSAYALSMNQPSPIGAVAASYEVYLDATNVNLFELAGVDYSAILTAYVRLTYIK